ncbi:MAG: AraC family transcriptional regulator [Comamonas sp.]
MRSPSPHQFHRLAALPWAELRVSQQSPHCYRLHMHAEYSLGIVDQGQTLFQHADGCELLTAGSVVLIEPGVWHACNPAQVTHWSYRMLYINADWLHAQMGVAGLRFPQRTTHATDTHHLLHALCRQLETGHASASISPSTAPHASDWTAQLLHLLTQPAIAEPLATAPPARQPETAAVLHALEQWHQHPDTAPSVQTLAQTQGMSASRFIRHFKTATGVTPGAYRLNLRLNGARRLLAQGTPLAEAAHAMGFADQSHLQRAFKSHHALTPGRYAQGLASPAPASL